MINLVRNVLKMLINSLFSFNNNLEFKFIENFSRESTYDSALKLVHYGWKKRSSSNHSRKKNNFS